MPALRRWLRRFGPTAAVAALGAAAGILTLGMTSGVRGDVGPGSVTVSLHASPSPGTAVALPPLGRITAATHPEPVRFELRVDQVDVDELQAALGRPDPEEDLRAAVDDDLPGLLRRLAIRATLAATLVGAVAGLLVPRRRWHHAVAGAAGGAVAAVLLLGAAWQDYDEEAFAEARYDGALERAPAILDAVRQRVGDLGEVRDRVAVLSRQVAGLYAATQREAGDAETVVLHISDIHSNPLGVELTRQLASSFAVDAIIDTGDLTSFGLPIESRVVELLQGAPAPYLFVPGNHDSIANRQTIAATAGVRLVDGAVASVGDLRVLGIGDPTFTASNEMSTTEANERKLELAADVARLVRRAGPDILAVHDRRQATDAVGAVPVVIAGHSHETTARMVDGTLVLTVGSTGATGLGSYLVETSSPYEAQLLRFDGRRLVAVDHVSMRGVAGEFTLERRVVDPDALVTPGRLDAPTGVR